MLLLTPVPLEKKKTGGRLDRSHYDPSINYRSKGGQRRKGGVCCLATVLPCRLHTIQRLCKPCRLCNNKQPNPKPPRIL